MIAIGIAALLAIVVALFIGARLAQPPAPTPTALPPSPSPPWSQEMPTVTQPRSPTKTVTETATITPRPPPVPRPAPVPLPRPDPRSPGDLGLRTPISTPLCNGQRIVVLGNVTTPGLYEEGIQQLLNQHPGASYLRTDQSCPSLRRTEWRKLGRATRSSADLGAASSASTIVATEDAVCEHDRYGKDRSGRRGAGCRAPQLGLQQ